VPDRSNPVIHGAPTFLSPQTTSFGQIRLDLSEKVCHSRFTIAAQTTTDQGVTKGWVKSPTKRKNKYCSRGATDVASCRSKGE
jgi:hypothetical protein